MKGLFKKVWIRVEPIAIDLIVICAILLSLSAITVLLHKLPLSKEQIEIIESIDFYAAVILILLFVSSTIIRLTKQEWKEIRSDEDEKERQIEHPVSEVKEDDKVAQSLAQHAVSGLSSKKSSKRRKR